MTPGCGLPHPGRFITMRTALICAICFFCGAALFAPTKQIFNVSPAAQGPFAIKGSRIWQFGPIPVGQSFELPAQPPTAPVIVMTGWAGDGFYFEKWDEAQQKWVYAFSWNSTGWPRPGILFPAGTYRNVGSQGICMGYYAPTTASVYPGSDEYIDATRIWQFAPLLDGKTEYEVPPNKVYMVTFAAAAVQRWDGSNWVTQIGAGYFGMWAPTMFPGVRLPPGRYRVNGSEPIAGGYITTEN